MKVIKMLLAGLFCTAALAAAGLGVWLAADNRDAAPVLVREDPAARQTAQALLDAVCAGDYETAGGMMLGSPELGVDRPAQDAVGVLLWDAYQQSLSFAPVGGCYATASGVAYDYTVRYMDLDSVTGVLRERSQTLLSQRVEQAEDMSEVYDENNEYREAFVMEVLRDAARQALAEDADYIERSFTVNLVYRDGCWWAVADDELLSAVSGSLAG